MIRPGLSLIFSWLCIFVRGHALCAHALILGGREALILGDRSCLWSPPLQKPRGQRLRSALAVAQLRALA